MGLQSLLKDAKVTRVMNAVAAGQTAQSTTALDMSGYDAVLYVVLFGTVTDNSVLTATANENASNSNSGGTAVTGGATAAVTAATNSNNVMLVDVVRQSKQYSYLTITRTAQNAAIDGVIAIQYRTRSLPVTQPTTVIGSALSTPEA